MTYSELAELLATKCTSVQDLIESDPKFAWVKGIIVHPQGGIQYLDREACDALIKDYPYQWQYIETHGHPIKKISFDAWLSYFNVLPSTTYMIRFYGSYTVRVAVNDFQIEEFK